MKAISLLFIVASILGGCLIWTERGFRFHGDYEAKKSGYRIRLLSQGYNRPEYDTSESSFVRVKFCPVKPLQVQEFQISIVELPETPNLDNRVYIRSNKPYLSKTEWSWKTSEDLLIDLLHRAGYKNLIPEEIKGSIKVIENSLSGTKGFVLKGQIDSLNVLETRIEYNYPVFKEQPPEEWIKPTELPSCH